MTPENSEAVPAQPESPIPNIGRPETPEGSSLKEYFDEKLYPHLSAALAACARERPEDPVAFVGEFLVHASQKH
jgi:hypothetical protein